MTPPSAGPPESAAASAGGSAAPVDASPLLDVRGLRYRYPGAGVDALAGLDLSVRAASALAVVGANGSGKSTLARLLGGLEKATRSVPGRGLRPRPP